MKHFFDYKTMSVARKLSISFIAVILLGSILLSLPIFQYANAPKTHYIDHLFTTVSMVCVTGLSVFPISKVYNGWGQDCSYFTHANRGTWFSNTNVVVLLYPKT